MNKLLAITLGVMAFLCGCSSPMKNQFMEGCTQGLNKSTCSCVYSKIEKKYGEKVLEEMNENMYLPDDFTENLVRFTESCM